MKNLKKFRFTILGALALITAVTLNVRHALNDYGVKDNRLHVEVLAQSNNSGGGGSGSGGGGSSSGGSNSDGGSSADYSYAKELSSVECSITEIVVGVPIKIGGITFPVGASYTTKGAKKACTFWLLAKCDQSKTTLCAKIQ